MTKHFIKKSSKLLLVAFAICISFGLSLIYLIGGEQTASAADTLPEAEVSSQHKLGEPRISDSRITAQTPITRRDIVVVFDVSGSMEYETNCFDCWVRTDPGNPNYPLNGYFNPLPYNTNWISGTGTTNSIPSSNLCLVAPSVTGVHTDTNGNQYLSHEAELYSRNQGDWRLSRRTPGTAFWAIQRGSLNINNPLNPDENGYSQGNQAGNVDRQSSNVCHPGTASNSITCQIGGDDICEDSDGGISVDCSAYIKSHPFPTYSQFAGGDPQLQGGSFNLDCFTGSQCWETTLPGSNEGRPVKSNIPYVEYDFYPQWAGTTQVWMRVLGGGALADVWAGLTPDTNGAAQDPWADAIMWEAFKDLDPTGSSVEGIQLNTDAGSVSLSRDTRADGDDWRWIKLGEISTNSVGGLYTLRLFQASSGYKIDKIVFTDATSDSDVRNFIESSTWDGKGPPATDGSATREACNFCNPAYGLTVHQNQCGCPKNAVEAVDYTNNYSTGISVRSESYWAGASGSKCTVVAGAEATPTNNLDNDLFSGLQPLRNTQEAFKAFAKQLDPTLDQVGLVAFTEIVKETTVSGKLLTVPLQCNQANPGDCAADDPFPLFMEAIERQWPQGPTNIGDGLRQGLKLLGIPGYGGDVCAPNNPDAACHRDDAQKIMIVLTDGSPNQNPGGACDDANLWNGDIAAGDNDYDCAIYYAKEAADNEVVVFTIGIGDTVNPDFLTAIATGRDPHSTSGVGEEVLFEACNGYYFATRLDELETVADTIAKTYPTNCEPQAINNVTLTGPTTGKVDTNYNFTATVEPFLATQPITYVWEASELSNTTQVGNLIDTIIFSWSSTGTKHLTVTAYNIVGTVVTASHTILLNSPDEMDTLGDKTYLPIIIKPQ